MSRALAEHRFFRVEVGVAGGDSGFHASQDPIGRPTPGLGRVEHARRHARAPGMGVEQPPILLLLVPDHHRVGSAIVNRIAEQSASALTKNDPLCSAQHSGLLLASAEGKISADQNWQLLFGGSGDHLRG